MTDAELGQGFEHLARGRRSPRVDPGPEFVDAHVVLFDAAVARLHDHQAHALDVGNLVGDRQAAQGVGLELGRVGLDLDTAAGLQIHDDHFVAADDERIGGAEGFIDAEVAAEVDALLDQDRAVGAGRVADIVGVALGHLDHLVVDLEVEAVGADLRVLAFGVDLVTL